MSNDTKWGSFLAANRVPASILDIKNNPEMGIVTSANITLDNEGTPDLTNLIFKLIAMHLDAENYEPSALTEYISQVVIDTFSYNLEYWNVHELHDVLEEVAARLEQDIQPSRFRDIFVNVNRLNADQATVTIAGRY